MTQQIDPRLLPLYERAALALKNADDIAILIHNRPDGDAIGCSFALFHALSSLHKRVEILCQDEPGKNFACITKGASVTKLLFEPKFIVMTDVSSFNQLGGLTAKYGPFADLVLDHHKVNDEICENMLIDPFSAAAGEIIFHLLSFLQVKLTPEIAMALYCSLSTDTGCFRFGNTTSKTHEIAAELMNTGIDTVPFNKLFFQTKSKARVKLEQAMLKNLTFHYNETLAISAVTTQMLASCGASEDETGQISNLTSEIEGVRAGVIIKQADDEVYKISMRSVREVDVADVCKKVGGGGHTQAAGCMLKGTLEQVRAQVVSLFEDVL